MRSHDCYYPAMVRRLLESAEEGSELSWLVKAAFALNRDLEGDCPDGPMWEYSVGWAASQCIRAAFILDLDELPADFEPVIHHLLLTLDLNRSVQRAAWCDPKRALELAAQHGFSVAGRRLAEGKSARPIPLGVLPALLSRATVMDPLDRVVAEGTAASQLVLGTHRNQPFATYSPLERAILCASVPLFGPRQAACRAAMWKVLAAEESLVGLPAKVVALVKLATWFALADAGEILRGEKALLSTLRLEHVGLQKLVDAVPEFVPDTVLA